MRGIVLFTIFISFQSVIFSAVIKVPDDYPTIQQAIDAADEHDLILVKPGTYVENIDFKGKTITLKNTSGSPSTVIDGNQSGSVVTFSGGEEEECVLEGFTLTNGSGSFLNPTYQYGGGVLCDAFCSATIRNNAINNNAADYGAGIYCRHASPVIEGNVISDNSAIDRGGALFCVSSSPVIRDNSITGSEAHYGSVLYCQGLSDLIFDNNIISGHSVGNSFTGFLYFEQDSSAAITGNTFMNNNCGHYGSCIVAYSASSMTIEDNMIIDNNASGIYCDEVQTLTIHGNTIQGNKYWGILSEHCDSIITNNVIAENERSGIRCNGGTPLIEGNVIIKNINKEGEQAGGINCYDCSATIRNNYISLNLGGNGGGIKSDNIITSPTIFITNNIITNNSAKSSGGGIACLNGGQPMISNNVITGNSAGNGGGGLYFLSIYQPIHLTNNIISKNKAYSSDYDWGGGGICTICIDKLYITNCTITGNIAHVNGGGIYLDYGEVAMVAKVSNTILWNNDALAGPEIWIGKIGNPSMDISYSDLRGGSASVHVEPGGNFNIGPGMIDADPLFVDSKKGDYHLRYTSPCRDIGDGSIPGLPDEDFEGDPRIAWSGAVDMGADEFYTHLYWMGDSKPGGNVELKFIGLPGTAPVQLWLGSDVLDPPIPTIYGDWYLQLPLLAEVGLWSIPAPDGVLMLPLTLPPTTPTPFTLPFQAGIGVELTNLCVMEVE